MLSYGATSRGGPPGVPPSRRWTPEQIEANARFWAGINERAIASRQRGDASDKAEAARMAAAVYTLEQDESGRWCVLDSEQNVLSRSTYRDMAERHIHELRTIPRPRWAR